MFKLLCYHFSGGLVDKSGQFGSLSSDGVSGFCDGPKRAFIGLKENG